MLTYGPTPTIDSDHIHLGAQGGLCGWGLGGLGGLVGSQGALEFKKFGLCWLEVWEFHVFHGL